MKTARRFTLFLLCTGFFALQSLQANYLITIEGQIHAAAVPVSLTSPCPLIPQGAPSSPMASKIVFAVTQALLDQDRQGLISGRSGYDEEVVWSITKGSQNYYLILETNSVWLGRMIYRYLERQKEQLCLPWDNLQSNELAVKGMETREVPTEYGASGLIVPTAIYLRNDPNCMSSYEYTTNEGVRHFVYKLEKTDQDVYLEMKSEVPRYIANLPPDIRSCQDIDLTAGVIANINAGRTQMFIVTDHAGGYLMAPVKEAESTRKAVNNMASRGVPEAVPPAFEEVSTGNQVYLEFDQACMNRLEYRKADNSSHVVYQLRKNDEEKIHLEVGDEMTHYNQSLPGVPTTCQNLQINELMARDINSGNVKFYVVRPYRDGYLVAPVRMAHYFYHTDSEIAYSSAEDYVFSFLLSSTNKERNLSTEASRSRVYFRGVTRNSCPVQYHFRKIPKERYQAYTDMIIVPRIGLLEVKTGRDAGDAERNKRTLVSFNGIPVDKYLEAVCKGYEQFLRNTIPDSYDQSTTERSVLPGNRRMESTGRSDPPVTTDKATAVIPCNIYKDRLRDLYINVNTGLPASGECNGVNYRDGYIVYSKDVPINNPRSAPAEALPKPYELTDQRLILTKPIDCYRIPTPSSVGDLPSHLFSDARTFADAKNILAKELNRAGLEAGSFIQRGFVTCEDGFLLVTELQGIAENGTPLYDPEVVTTDFSYAVLADINNLSALAPLRDGYYHFFVFKVSSGNRQYNLAKLSSPQLAARGPADYGITPELNEEIAQWPFEQYTAVEVLLYKIQKRGDVQLVEGIDISIFDHLRNANLWRKELEALVRGGGPANN